LEAQPRLFQPFVQAEGSTSRRYGGTGLGPVIAAQLVRQMNGEIGYESTPGKGSRFHFTMRFECAREVAAAPSQSATGSSIGAREWRRAIRILLIEDNPTNQLLTSEQLAMLGYSAEIAGDAASGLEKMEREGFDIVLMDCELPTMDGYQATAEIRRREQGI